MMVHTDSYWLNIEDVDLQLVSRKSILYHALILWILNF